VQHPETEPKILKERLHLRIWLVIGYCFEIHS
jgi:hypothetical protein